MSKLKASVIAELAEHVSNGLSNQDSARLAGISEATFYRWLREAADEKTSTPDHQQLVAALENAEASFKAVNLGIIRSAATDSTVETRVVDRYVDGKLVTETTTITRPPTWQPAAWLLERRFPGEYGRRFIEHAGKLDTDGEPKVVHVVFGTETDPEDPEPEP